MDRTQTSKSLAQMRNYIHLPRESLPHQRARKVKKQHHNEATIKKSGSYHLDRFYTPTYPNQTASIFSGKRLRKSKNYKIQCCQPKFPLNLDAFLPIMTNRARYIDWLLQVCSLTHQSYETYWCTLDLIDQVINYGGIRLNNLHLCGITCLFMASKFYEKEALKLKTITKQILHDEYNYRAILEQQKIYLMMISKSQLHLMRANIYHILIEQLRIGPEKGLSQVYQCIKNIVFLWMHPTQQLCGRSYREVVKKVIKSVEAKQTIETVEMIKHLYLTKHGCSNHQNYLFQIRL